MKAHNGNAAGLAEQLPLGTIDEEALKISATMHEIEQKYLLGTSTDGDCKKIRTDAEVHISTFLKDRSVSVTPFEGVEDSYHITTDEKDFFLRFRASSIEKWKLQLKGVRNENLKCTEINIGLRTDTPEANIRVFLDTIGSFGETCTRLHSKSYGSIRYIVVTPIAQEKIKIVTYISRNLDTGYEVAIGEIEAHGFKNHASATEHIRFYENALGWTSKRTSLKTSQLLAPVTS